MGKKIKKDQKDSCLCGSWHMELLYTCKLYPIYRCLDCGQVRTGSLSKRHRKYAYTEKDIAVYKEKEKYFRQLFERIVSYIERFVSGGIFVDVGAGIGLCADVARKHGYTVYGTEYSKPAIGIARKQYGINLIRGPLTPAVIPKKANVILYNHVLEHMDDPAAEITKSKLLLGPGGILVIGVPNIANPIAWHKKGKWQSLVPDQHHWHFSLATLDRIILPNGFVRIDVRSESHDRTAHRFCKRFLYAVFDTIANTMNRGEALLVVYRSI